jgi:hypothetical protein
MSDGFDAFLNELGEEIFGVQWVLYRPAVARWTATNPERVLWLRRRLYQLAREGTL